MSLRFYKEQDEEGDWNFKWRHSECPVMKWYKQQTQSSTKFTTIEHRRVLKAPFHHEYLLIHLDDGAICRLERMGEGSRADAIRRVGCTAHDIIQWFAKDTYNNNQLSKEPSELVARVEFPRAFDMLDVLAVCFSIQKVKMSSNYTLQRYNCYFLCLTVLSTLVRRTAGWESVITNDIWIAAVGSMISELQTMECRDEYENLGINICSMVIQDIPEPRGFILDALSEVLIRSGLPMINGEVDNTLWHEDLKMAPHAGLKDGIKLAAELALGGTDIHSIKMKQLLEEDSPTESADNLTPKPSRMRVPPKVEREVHLSYATTMTRAMRAVAKSTAVTYAMREVEDPTPLHLRLISSLLAVAGCVAMGLGCDFGIEEEFQLDQANILTRVQVATRLLPVFLYGARASIIEDSDDPSLQEMETFNDEAWDHARIASINSIIHSALFEGLDPSSILQITGFDMDDWKLCLGVCVGTYLNKAINISGRCSSMGTVDVYTPANLDGSQMSVVDFQGIIIKRIHDHADRVAAVGLAAAPLVHGEIQRTIAMVWKEIPDRRNWGSPNGSSSEPEQSNPEGSLEAYGWKEFLDHIKRLQSNLSVSEES